MPKKRIETHWEPEIGAADLKPALKRCARHLEEIDLRDTTISSYVFRVGKFLEFAQDDAPNVEDFKIFRETSIIRSSHGVQSTTTVLPSRDIRSCVGNYQF